MVQLTLKIPPQPNAIRELRVASSLTQAEAAALIRCSTSGWKKWELGLCAMPDAYWELFQLKLKCGLMPEVLYRLPSGYALRSRRMQASLREIDAAELLGVTLSRWRSWEQDQHKMPLVYWELFNLMLDPTNTI